jgi:hypothetical protein
MHTSFDMKQSSTIYTVKLLENAMRNANKLIDDTDKHQSKINFAQLHYVLSYGYLNLKEFKKSLANLEDGIQYQSDYIDDILKGKQNIRIQAETYSLSGETAVRSSSNKPQGKLRTDKLQEIFDNEYLIFIKMFWFKAEINLKSNYLHEAIYIYNKTMDMITEQYGINNRAFAETNTLKSKLLHKMSKDENTKPKPRTTSLCVSPNKESEIVNNHWKC